VPATGYLCYLPYTSGGEVAASIRRTTARRSDLHRPTGAQSEFPHQRGGKIEELLCSFETIDIVVRLHNYIVHLWNKHFRQTYDRNFVSVFNVCWKQFHSDKYLAAGA
jgi:hypothetical protein